jgi:hypothetical protein
MITATAKIHDRTNRVTQAVDKAAFRNIGHAAASIAKDMKGSIERGIGPSEPGTPPHTHTGSYLRRAIRYAAGKREAVIGARYSVVAKSAAAHEHGQHYKGTQYPKRPFAVPALVRGAPRFGGSFAGSVGQ